MSGVGDDDASASHRQGISPQVALHPGEVQVWIAGLQSKHESPADPWALSTDERSRAEKFRFDRDRDRFVSARTTLRVLLSAYVGASPDELEFDGKCRFCGRAHGKPRLVGANTDFDFSLSYSGDAVLVAISSAGAVGADVEALPSLDDLDELEDAATAISEAKLLRAMAPETRRQTFALLWTLKEAVLKAAG